MNNTAKLEALLFIHGEPVSLKKVQEILGFEEADLKEALLDLNKALEGEGRGLVLISEVPVVSMFEEGSWGSKKIQLATHPDMSETLAEFVKSEMNEELTPASLEVASLVAYLGPISKTRIEYIRGVNSMFTLRSLMMRGLVERSADPNVSGSFLYKPTLELFKHLGVSSREELPDYEKFKTLAEAELNG